MIWLALPLLIVLHAEPDRFLGGAPSTPLAVPGPVDESPALQACSTETLAKSSGCHFDARPLLVEGDAPRRKQASANVELAASLGKRICLERIEETGRVRNCVEQTARASRLCSLEGVEVLLDADGRFSTKARACYEAIAASVQAAEVPPVPAEAAPRMPAPVMVPSRKI